MHEIFENYIICLIFFVYIFIGINYHIVVGLVLILTY